MDTKQFANTAAAFRCSLVKFVDEHNFFKCKLASRSDAAFSGTIRFITRIQFCLFESKCCNKIFSESIKSSGVAKIIR